MRKCCNLAHKDLNDLLWSVDKTVRDVLDSQELKNLGSEIKDSLSRAGGGYFRQFFRLPPAPEPRAAERPLQPAPPAPSRRIPAGPGASAPASRQRPGGLEDSGAAPELRPRLELARTAGPRATAGRPGPGMPRPKAPTAARLWAANPAGSGAAQWQRRGSAFSAPSAGL